MIAILNQEKIDDLTESAPTWEQLIDVSEVVSVTGMKRHGKSALIYYLTEYLAKVYNKPIYTWGVPLFKRKLFPEIFKHFDDLTVIERFTNAVVSLDEFHRGFNSRTALRQDNVEFSDVLTFSGQNNQELLISTLNNGLLDINMFRICNPVLAYKRVGNLQAISERSGIRKYTEQAKDAWNRIPRGRKGTPERALEAQLTYIISEEYIGWMKNPMPTWWSENISEIHSKALQKVVKDNKPAITSIANKYQVEYLDFITRKATKGSSLTPISRLKRQYPIERYYVEHILKDEWESDYALREPEQNSE